MYTPGPPALLWPRLSSLLVAASQIAFVFAVIRHPQTIFHAVAQQNPRSSPQTSHKTNNPSPINKIKLSPKRFLVMVNPVK
jgi:hypothetical protein